MIGWQCPRCNRCYSPFVQACSCCGPVTISGTSTNCTCHLPPTTAVCPVHGDAATRAVDMNGPSVRRSTSGVQGREYVAAPHRQPASAGR